MLTTRMPSSSSAKGGKVEVALTRTSSGAQPLLGDVPGTHDNDLVNSLVDDLPVEDPGPPASLDGNVVAVDDDGVPTQGHGPILAHVSQQSVSETFDLAILGSGAQAMSHLEAMSQVRRIVHTTVWSRTVEHAERFARAAADRLGVDVEVARTVAAAVAEADIVCTVTGAQTPILDYGLMRRGTHINAVGSGSAVHREISSAVVRDATVYVDRIESALREAGEIVLAIADGTITDAHIRGEIGAVLSGRIGGRQSADEVTLFKSVGLGVEDVAAARMIYAECVRNGLGADVQFGVSTR